MAPPSPRAGGATPRVVSQPGEGCVWSKFGASVQESARRREIDDNSLSNFRLGTVAADSDCCCFVRAVKIMFGASVQGPRQGRLISEHFASDLERCSGRLSMDRRGGVIVEHVSGNLQYVRGVCPGTGAAERKC